MQGSPLMSWSKISSLGSPFHAFTQLRRSFSKACTLRCSERCSRSRVTSAKSRSTWLIQDEYVGVKCMRNRGCFPARTESVWRGFQKVVFQRLESSVPPIGKSPTGGGPPSSPSQAGPGMLDRFLRVVNLTQIRVPVQSHGHRRVQNPVDQRFRGDLVGNHLQPILGTQL